MIQMRKQDGGRHSQAQYPALSTALSTQYSVLHRVLNDLRQVLPSVLTRDIANARREVQHAPLRDRALDERRDVALRVPDGLEPARDVEAVEEARDRLVQVRADRAVRDRGDRRVGRAHAVEDREGFAVPIWVGRRGELEDGGRGEGDAVCLGGQVQTR